MNNVVEMVHFIKVGLLNHMRFEKYVMKWVLNIKYSFPSMKFIDSQKIIKSLIYKMFTHDNLSQTF